MNYTGLIILPLATAYGAYVYSKRSDTVISKKRENDSKKKEDISRVMIDYKSMRKELLSYRKQGDTLHECPTTKKINRLSNNLSKTMRLNSLMVWMKLTDIPSEVYEKIILNIEPITYTNLAMTCKELLIRQRDPYFNKIYMEYHSKVQTFTIRTIKPFEHKVLKNLIQPMFPFWLQSLFKENYYEFEITAKIWAIDSPLFHNWKFTILDGPFIVRYISTNNTVHQHFYLVRGSLKDGVLSGLYFCTEIYNAEIRKLSWSFLRKRKIVSQLTFMSTSACQTNNFDADGKFQSYEYLVRGINVDEDGNFEPNLQDTNSIIPLTKEQVLNDSMEMLSDMLSKLVINELGLMLAATSVYNPEVPNMLDIIHDPFTPEQMIQRRAYPHKNEIVLENESPFLIDHELTDFTPIWFNNVPGDFQFNEILGIPSIDGNILFHPIFYKILPL